MLPAPAQMSSLLRTEYTSRKSLSEQHCDAAGHNWLRGGRAWAPSQPEGKAPRCVGEHSGALQVSAFFGARLRLNAAFAFIDLNAPCRLILLPPADDIVVRPSLQPSRDRHDCLLIARELAAVIRVVRFGNSTGTAVIFLQYDGIVDTRQVIL